MRSLFCSALRLRSGLDLVPFVTGVNSLEGSCAKSVVLVLRLLSGQDIVHLDAAVDATRGWLSGAEARKLLNCRKPCYMEKGLIEKTGESLAHWVAIVNKESFERHGEIIKFLKESHGFTHGFANFVAHKAREIEAGGPASDDNLVDSQYKGKESLYPIYTKLVEAINKFGDDIEIVPKKGSVSFRTTKQFALIQPSTKTRVDLGLKIKDKSPEGRLEGSGPFGTMCTHRIQLLDVKDVDEEVVNYINEAYQASK